jgi:hypothetical protein
MATIALSGSVLLKAGVGVNADITSGVIDVDSWIEEAEGYLSALTKYDLVSNWITLSGSSAGPMLSEYCARNAAIEAISYDMSNYTDGIEAENMITIHWSRMLQIQELLENSDVQDFIGTN